MDRPILTSVDLGDVRLHVREDGPSDGPAVVFANSLGTDLRLWDGVVARLPRHLRLVRYDKRGHGLSDAPPGRYSMDALVRDAEGVCDALAVRACVLVGLSIGGMIAQGLASRRPDLVHAMVLSNTAAKIGTAETWAERIDAVNADGIDAVSDAVMERWFSPAFRASPMRPPWQRMLETQPAHGYVGCMAAIQGTDFYAQTAALHLPTLAIGGDLDGSTPPDLVRETAALIPGARFELMRGVGHLPCVEDPAGYATILADFLASVGYGG